MTFFPLTRARSINSLTRHFAPDIVHLHGGVITPVFAYTRAIRRPVVASVYGWAGPPSRDELKRSSVSELRGTPAAQARVLVTGLLPERAVRRLLSPSGPVRGVITQDLELAKRLDRLSSVPVRVAEIGSGIDGLRAVPSFERPVVAFAGRAETVRGADVLIDAMPLVLRRHPGARLRLMVLPAPQLPALVEMVRRSPAREAIDLVTEPVSDLREEFARCTMAVFPFKFDHTTAMAPPLTVTEAMSVGLPVVVSAVRCMDPIIDARRCAVVIPPCDPDAVARAIDAVLQPARWQTLASSAVRLVTERWNWDNAAAVTSALYEEVLRDGR